MAQDVLITPASRKIEWYGSDDILDAKIETDASGNLLITNPGGDIAIGDTTADVYIGDGVNNIDIVFEQNGEIRGLTGVTVTFGQADSFIAMGTNLNLANNNIINVNSITATSITASLTGTASVASTVTLTATNTTNATHYLTFTDAATGNEDIRTDTNLTYNPSTNTLTTTNFAGQATTAKYADLAENYLADRKYPIGTVLEIGGDKEVTVAKQGSHKVVGTVSKNPGYLMNSELSGDYVTPVAYIGRVPCRVVGKIERGDCLVVGSISGVAESKLPQNILPGELIGKALEPYDSINQGIIEILVGRL